MLCFDINNTHDKLISGSAGPNINIFQLDLRKVCRATFRPRISVCVLIICNLNVFPLFVSVVVVVLAFM